MEKLGVSSGCFPLVEVVHVELSERCVTCRINEAMLECLK